MYMQDMSFWCKSACYACACAKRITRAVTRVISHYACLAAITAQAPMLTPGVCDM